MKYKKAYRTIRIYDSSFELLNSFCSRYSLTKTEFIELILEYFNKTKIDPRDTTDVSSEVKKLKNQLIAFIKTQEKEKLNPLIRKQDLLIDKFKEIISDDLVDKKYLIEALTQTGNQIVKKIKNDN